MLPALLPAPFHLLNDLCHDAHGRGETHKKQKVQDAQALGLEDLLQRREVDDQQLAHDGPEDGVAEHSVAAESDLQHRLGLGSGAQCIEHVKKHKACESHGRVPRGYHVVSQLTPEDKQSPTDNNY